jgi:hypothetical protein
LMSGVYDIAEHYLWESMRGKYWLYWRFNRSGSAKWRFLICWISNTISISISLTSCSCGKYISNETFYERNRGLSSL